MPGITVIKVRRGTAAAWTAADPILALGEPGLETDTGPKLKFGTGIDAWSVLPYFAGGGGTTNTPVVGEAFTGDGATVNFVLAFTPITGSVAVYVNGVRVNSFSVAAATVTFAAAPALNDEILVDYLYAASFSGVFVAGEAFTGDGVTVNFVLVNVPLAGSVAVYVNGVRVSSFTVAGSTVTFTMAPALGDEILVDYFY